MKVECFRCKKDITNSIKCIPSWSEYFIDKGNFDKRLEVYFCVDCDRENLEMAHKIFISQKELENKDREIEKLKQDLEDRKREYERKIGQYFLKTKE